MTLRSFASIAAACGALALTAQAPQPSATPAATTSSECPQTAVDTRHFLNASAYTVRAPLGPLALVAVRDESSRARGLMCVTSVPPGKGMLFVFAPPDRRQAFWMKNTLVGLDMVFVRRDGTVSTVAANVPPTPDGTPDTAVARREGIGRYVIELGAGDAARHGIASGTKLALPSLDAQE